jgi:hypothetical protein
MYTIGSVKFCTTMTYDVLSLNEHGLSRPLPGIVNVKMADELLGYYQSVGQVRLPALPRQAGAADAADHGRRQGHDRSDGRVIACR